MIFHGCQCEKNKREMTVAPRPSYGEKKSETCSPENTVLKLLNSDSQSGC